MESASSLQLRHPEFLGGASGGTSVKETGGVADVYATIIFGEDAYGEVPLRDSLVQL